MAEAREDVIRCEGIWKIFGDKSRQAMEAVRSKGLSKKDIREQFDCVVGVQDASFSVGRGEIFCIMGLSGSGKSTLIRHINRLIEPTSGAVYIEGENVNAMNPQALRKLRAEKIGMVFQSMALMPHRTVRDNVAFSLEVRGKSEAERAKVAAKAIEMVDLTGWDKKYPDELSGGMQQRVGLARALAADPTILLMDEPFSALDPLIRRQLQGTFMELSAELHKTTVFITHDLDEAIRIGTRIAIMKDGEIIQVGKPAEIVAHPADAYVAAFVANISRLNVVQAQTIMEAPRAYQARHPAGIALSALPAVRPDMTISELIRHATATDAPLAVIADGQVVGVIDQAQLLRSIQGGEG